MSQQRQDAVAGFRIVRVSLRETTIVDLAVPANVSDETARRLGELRWNGSQFDAYRRQSRSGGNAVILSSDTIERDALVETGDGNPFVAPDYPNAAVKFWKMVTEAMNEEEGAR